MREVHADAALSVLQGHFALVAPEFLVAEVGNVLLKKVRRGEMQMADAEGAADLIDIFVTLADSSPLYETAFALALALQYNRSFYDALYVALALAEECRLVTADQRLYNALQPALPETMLWVGDVGPL